MTWLVPAGYARVRGRSSSKVAPAVETTRASSQCPAAAERGPGAPDAGTDVSVEARSITRSLARNPSAFSTSTEVAPTATAEVSAL